MTIQLSEIKHDTQSTAVQVDQFAMNAKRFSNSLYLTMTTLALNIHAHGDNTQLKRFFSALPNSAKSKQIAEWFVSEAKCLTEVDIKKGVARVDKKRLGTELLTCQTLEAENLREAIANPVLVSTSKPVAFDKSKAAMKFLNANLKAMTDTETGLPHDVVGAVDLQALALDFIQRNVITVEQWNEAVDAHQGAIDEDSASDEVEVEIEQALAS